MSVPLTNPPKKQQGLTTLQILAQAAAGTVAVTALDAYGSPEGWISGIAQSLPATALAFGGPLALGVLASQALDTGADPLMHAGVASALAVAGMMATNMIPRVVDMATLTTVAAAAAGVYVGAMYL